MTHPTFVSSFGGSRLIASKRASFRHAGPRCAMGDSIAPKIRITDTKSDQTSSITITWETVTPNEGNAVAVSSNMSLAASLKSKSVRGKILQAAAKQTIPPGVSAADFYFPKNIRNIAPVLTLGDSKIKLSMEEVNPVVGGVAANSVDSVAFWKTKSHKYSAADLPPPLPDTDEPVSTAAFERYFPSKRRNWAPKIEIRAPKGEWDSTAYVIVKNEYTALNYVTANNLKVPEVGEASKRPNRFVEKYFGKNKSYAPAISIDAQAEKVEFSLEEVPLRDAEAAKLSAKYA